jgi:hypothetical protein
MRNEAEIRALRVEGEQYLAAGMIDRAQLVNEQLRARGAETITLPTSSTTAPRQKRTSTQASTRQKRSS